MLINANDTILFTGDSITDCSRVRTDPDHLGIGYAYFAASRLKAYLPSPELRIFNRGINGNRAIDLVNRLEADLLALKPTVVSILVGINDSARRYTINDPMTAAAFEASYRTLLEKIRAELDARIVLLEPFLIHVRPEQRAWREDLNPKIDVVRDLAAEFGADLLPIDGLFAKATTQAPPEYWAEDGVHPTPAGHALIAEAWLENADLAA